MVTNVSVTESVKVEVLVSDIIRMAGAYIHNGMTIQELLTILKNVFGIAERYCFDLVQAIKIELDMYCPDREHLYFVSN
jgi:hypothetical protein